MKYEVWLDMDETIVNLSKAVVERYNRDFNDNFDYRMNTEYYWGDCSKAPKLYFENLLQQPLIFYEAEPMIDSIKYINELISEGFEVNIVTLPQFNSQYSMNEKISFLKKWVPKINISKQVYFCGDKSKLAAPGRILIDDNINHLKAWRNNGGLAIAYDQYWNRDWHGERVHNHKELYDLIHELNYDKKPRLDVWRGLR